MVMPISNSQLDEVIRYGQSEFIYPQVPPPNGLVLCFSCEEREIHVAHSHIVTSALIHNPNYTQGSNESYWVRRNTHLCDDCVVWCEFCGDNAIHESEDNNHSGIDLCPSCDESAVRCDHCDCLVHGDNTHDYDRTSGSYCEQCRDDNTERCDSCGDTWFAGNDDDACECSSQSDLINSYSYKPDALFRHVGVTPTNRLYGEFATMPFLGFELEVEAGSNDRRYGAELFTDVIDEELLYLKDDGSLDDGFEIVTHPMTLDYYQSEFNWDPIQKLRDLKFKSWSTRTCGFHIHISRDAFYTKQLHRNTNASPHMYGFLLFIYKNAAEVEAISGRNSTYGRITDSELEHAFAYSSRRARSDRYVAVNTNNRHTLELRCFKGSLNHDRIMGYLEFVDAVFHYTKTNRITKLRDSMDFLAFTQWCEMQPRYDNLLSLIHRSGALDAE